MAKVQNQSNDTESDSSEVSELKELFIGQDWSKINTSQGVSNLKIVSQNLGNVPGLVPHWNAEIEKRREAILEWKKRSFVNRAMSLLGKFAPQVPPEISGEEIAKFHPTKVVSDQVELLKKDPCDCDARLQLVSAIGKSGRALTPEMFRLLILQSTVAHTFGVFSSKGVQTAIWAQTAYLNKMITQCREDSLSYQNKVEEGDNVFAQQKKNIEQLIEMIRKHSNLIQSYLGHIGKTSEPGKKAYPGFLTVEEITSFEKRMQGKEHDEVQHEKNMIFTKSFATIHFLRYHLLLEKYAHELAEALIQLDPKHPWGYFLNARLYMSELVLTTLRYRAGEQSNHNKKQIQELFKLCYNQYGNAVNRAKRGSEFTMVIEYVSALHFFIQIATSRVGISLPRPWVADNLKKAMTLLDTMKPDPKVTSLKQYLKDDLNFFQIS